MNPFQKRATEYIREDLGFLPFVSPEPLHTFFEEEAQDDALYDRLVTVIGTPGSGKTTLARLFMFSTLTTLLKTSTSEAYKPLVDALTACKALGDNEEPLVAGCRIPLESDFRDFIELPYEPEFNGNLMYSFLQARAVLGWLRGFEQAGIDIKSIKMIPRPEAEAALVAIGGADVQALRDKARAMESQLYSIVSDLIPPEKSSIAADAIGAYKPFDVIDRFEVIWSGKKLRLIPLVVIDDAHELHPDQFASLVKRLRRREIKLARWVLTRFDALSPYEILVDRQGISQTGPGVDRDRDVRTIWMQANRERAAVRKSFRRAAKDMATRYLGQMSVFSRRRLTNLADMLSEESPTISSSKLTKLRDSVDTIQRKHKVHQSRRQAIDQLVAEYLGDEASVVPDVSLMMSRILLERYARRIPSASLFPADDPEPSKPLAATQGVRGGAEIILLHEYERPYFFGIDRLCDSASDNAETFLHLAGHLVDQLETQLIRDSERKLSPAEQHRLLVERANQSLADRVFPEKNAVLVLAKEIARQCVAKSLEPNTPLDDGANAFGILQDDFDKIETTHPEVAEILQYGFAYNIFSLVRDYNVKNKVWCLVELTGVMSLSSGLTLLRGGFLERTLNDLSKVVSARQSA